MAKTARYLWPTPNLSDEPDVPEDMSVLAAAVEETVGSMDDRLTTLTGLTQTIFQYTTLTRVSSNVVTIPGTVWTPIPFDAVQYNKPDNAPGFVSQNPTRITCMQTGLYRLSGFAGFEMKTGGSRGVSLRLNRGSTYLAINSGLPPADIEWYGSVFIDAKLFKNDYVELCVRQTSGQPLKLDTVQPRFSMQRLL